MVEDLEGAECLNVGCSVVGFIGGYTFVWVYIFVLWRFLNITVSPNPQFLCRQSMPL